LLPSPFFVSSSEIFIYAYRKTGLLGIGGDKSAWDPADVEEWNAAVDEGRAAQATKKPAEPQEQPGDAKLATELSLSLADVRRWRHSISTQPSKASTNSI